MSLQANTLVVEDHQATLREPLLKYNEYTFLTIKNPSNGSSKEELLRIYYHLMDIIGFTSNIYIWYESGKQKQQHVHAIIKKQWRFIDISKISKSYKQKKLKWFEYGRPQFENELGEVLQMSLDTSNFTFHLQEIKDHGHLMRLIYEYRFKEREFNFIDTDIED